MADALKPHVFQILLSLAGRPLHGTAIMEEVLERTEGTVRLWPGTLYGSLRELEAEGVIAEAEAPPDAPTEGGKRRFYRLTPSGEALLREEVARLRATLEVARERDLVEEV